jgi:hypothetical protein
MNRAQTLSHQAAFRDFARIDHWHAPHAVTLTMKQGMPVANGYRSTMAYLDEGKASQNLGHFHSVLSRKLLGKPADRYGKRVPLIPVIEGGNGKRLHYHVMIDCPRADLQSDFSKLVRDTWLRTQWGHDQIDIQPQADIGWINYISKFRDKPNYSDAVDWPNYHNPD